MSMMIQARREPYGPAFLDQVGRKNARVDQPQPLCKREYRRVMYASHGVVFMSETAGMPAAERQSQRLRDNVSREVEEWHGFTYQM